MVITCEKSKAQSSHSILTYCCCQERGVAEDVKDVLAGRDEDGLALTDADAVDVGFAPETHHDDE